MLKLVADDIFLKKCAVGNFASFVLTVFVDAFNGLLDVFASKDAKSYWHVVVFELDFH